MITSRRDKYVIVSGFDKSLTSEQERTLRDMLFMIRKNGLYYTWLYLLKKNKRGTDGYDSINIFLIDNVFKKSDELSIFKSMLDLVELIRNLSHKNPYEYVCLCKEAFEFIEVVLEVGKLPQFQSGESCNIYSELDRYVKEKNKEKKNSEKFVDERYPIFNRVNEGVENIGLRIDKYYGFEEYLKRNNTLDESLLFKASYSQIKQVNVEEAISNNQLNIVRELYGNNFIDMEIATINKLIISLGETDAKENSIKLHHIYGFPYIPSSAIKGAFKAYLANKEDKSYNLTEIFGDEDKKGNINIYDSYPLKFKIGVDIVNCHYRGYYSNTSNYPHDDRKLAPNKFYVVEDGTFKVILGYTNRIDTAIISEFTNFLNSVSFGAKKSVGYGDFYILDKKE